jgi:hypothetical protein
MRKAQLFDPLGICADGGALGADLGLREHDTYLHDSCPSKTTPGAVDCGVQLASAARMVTEQKNMP